MRTDWTKADETADTLPAPANTDHDAVESWIDTFMARMRDADAQVAVLLATDLAALGDA